MRKKRIILFSLPVLFSLLMMKEKETEKNFLLSLLTSDTSSVIRQVMEDPEKFRLQIVYTQVSRDQRNRVSLKTYTYRTDIHEYFYPASMAKLPVAALTLEKINDLKLRNVSPDSLYLKVYAPKNPAPPCRIADELMKMFVVSNNSAFNDLYDFLGQESINKRLWEMGYTQSKVIQKFQSTDSLGHRTALPVQLYTSDSTVYYERGTLVNPVQWKNDAAGTMVGKGYYDDKKLVRKPKDFSYSNYLPLTDLHQMLIALFYPSQLPVRKRFRLAPDDLALMKRYMSMYPREAGVEEWKNENVYYDSFRKYLLVGNNKSRIDSCLTIYNKVGQAYGFMTDCAYIKDAAKDVEFFLSATIYVNNNEIINDGKYEYNSIGFPFLHRLGEVIYNHELKRSRKALPRE